MTKCTMGACTFSHFFSKNQIFSHAVLNVFVLKTKKNPSLQPCNNRIIQNYRGTLIRPKNIKYVFLPFWLFSFLLTEQIQ